MPTYQYVCTDCGEPLEVVQSFSDPALTTCPVCEGRLRKVFSAVGVVFKGSGFYRTDSRAGSGGTGKDGGKPAKESVPAAAGSSTGSSDGSSSGSGSGSGAPGGSSGSSSSSSGASGGSSTAAGSPG